MSESDEFDKEAEREKLREKLERDEEKRQHTRQMSELLLKGATMTNRHCEECGDPIFSHDGQEFCPTCSQPGGNDGNGTATAESETGAHQQGQSTQGHHEPETAGRTGQRDTAQSGQPSGGSRSSTNGNVDPEADVSGGIAERAAAREPQLESNTDFDQSKSGQEVPASSQTRDKIEADVGARTTDTTEPEVGDVDLSEARQSLARTVTKYAQAAEKTDDPRQAQEYLKAAREAAEALTPLRENGRTNRL